MQRRRYSLLILFSLITSITFANDLTLQPNAPLTYVVKEGDTLWGIADKFLKRPWQWQALWYANPEIDNPTRLYPGATIRLHRLGQRPYLEYVHGTRHLSPKIKHVPLTQAIPPIDLDEIKPFLNSSLVVGEDRLRRAGAVVAFGQDHVIGGNSHHVFVSHLAHQQQEANYSIYRDGGPYRDPVRHRILGYAAIHIADARLVRAGDPATLLLTQIWHGVKPGDRVLVQGSEFNTQHFIPHEPDRRVRGHIINLFDALSHVGSRQAVVIDRGARDGISTGTVLSIVAPGRSVPDPVHHDEIVRLPDEHIGELMVFRTFDQVSFALIMQANSPVKLLDLVKNPA